MNDRISKMANYALNNDLVPKSVPEKVKNKNELKDAVSIAKGLRSYLNKQPVVVLDNELIVGRYRFKACEYPADYYLRAGHHNLSNYWSTFCHANHPTDLFYWGWTHLSLDYGLIVSKGLKYFLKRIEDSKQKYSDDSSKMNLLNGMEISLFAIQEHSEKYAKECERLAALSNDENEKEKYINIAKNCRKTPMNPADNFYEAIQSVYTAFLVNPDSLGRIDQYLYPYYKDDLENERITKENAFELLQELFIKVYGTQIDNTFLPISGHNHLVVGGYLENGDDGYNELSALIMEAIAELPTFRPQVSFRYTSKTTPETMSFITEMNKKCPLIVFVNDEPRITGMQKAGIEYKDAVNYTVVGCNEWAICGKSKLDLVHINLVHSLTELLYNQREKALKCNTYDEFYSLFEKSLHNDILSIAKEYETYYKEQAKDLNVLTSAFMVDCIDDARSFTDGGAKYYGLSMSFNGISNVADSLSVIKQFVFGEKILSMKQLLMMLDKNWNGFENNRINILRTGKFFGNDIDYVDDIACNIVDSIEASRSKINSPCLKNVVFGSFVGATHPNIVLAKSTGATPDGRYSGEEFTMGISQSQSKDANGLTALLKSIAKLDYEKFCGCIVSNIKLDKKMVDTPDKLDRLSALYHTFLKLGGMQLQINYISTKELIEAQINPENYKNLMVRVTGYSGCFTLFDTDLQNDIIKRTQYSAM